jgi:NADH-quinone oxidoreductase subunit C
MATVDQLMAHLQQHFAESANLYIAYDQITLEIQPDALLASCLKLRDNPEFQFDLLIDVCGVDYLLYGVDEWATQSATSQGFSRGVMRFNTAEAAVARPARFAVVYHLLSTQLNQRLRLKVFTPGEPPHIPSVLSIWNSANWYEREAFDLFGIIFDGHPDLRRILTDYGFIGHPFRKDFPLIGQVEMSYDALAARVIYEPVSIAPRTLVPKVIRQIGQKEHG